jgi:hypothetical protein
VAEKVVALYWDHVRPWPVSKCAAGQESAMVLRQATSGQGPGAATIVQRIHGFRCLARDAIGSESLFVAKARLDEEYRALVDEVEWTLILYPLPKLQRVGGEDTDWLFWIDWDDGARAPTRGLIRRYQRGEDAEFDNRVILHREVAAVFRSLHGVLRPFVLQNWALRVASWNGLEADRLYGFMFGQDRKDLNRRFSESLTSIQKGKCFYCGSRLTPGQRQVDHFLPWSRHPENGLHNLVVADRRCNLAKKDFLAACRHVERWRARNEKNQEALTAIAEETHWETGEDRVVGVARSIYLTLPEDYRLWSGCGTGRGRSEFERYDRRALRDLLE